MSEMVERVARAIDPEAWADDLPVPTRADVISFHAGRQKSAAAARVAIAAMREPTREQRHAGYNGVQSIQLAGDEAKAVAAYQAMIDSALRIRNKRLPCQREE